MQSIPRLAANQHQLCVLAAAHNLHVNSELVATANAEHRIARHHERVTDKTRSRVGETRAGAHHDVLSASRVEERRASRVLQRQIERRQVRATARIAEARREANALLNDWPAICLGWVPRRAAPTRQSVDCGCAVSRGGVAA